MDDRKIVELYLKRDQSAITETQNKYGKLCLHIASNILHSPEDAEEAANDTFFSTWSSIPPNEPDNLGAYVCKIARNTALKMLRSKNTGKRGGGDFPVALEELAECIPHSETVETAIDARFVAEALNSFLDSLSADKRQVFVCRYWYLDSIDDISQRFGYGKSKIKMMLKRTRQQLYTHLRKENIEI